MSNSLPRLVLPEPKIKVLNQLNDVVPGVRLYTILKTTTGETKVVPSVSTCLKNHEDDNFGLSKWYEDLGQQRADFVVKMATDVGNRYHRSIQWYFDGYLSEEEQQAHVAHSCIKNIKQLALYEKPVASWEHCFAGTPDLIYIDHEDRLRVTDNKSHRRTYSDIDELYDEKHLLNREIQPSKLTKYRKQVAPYGKGFIETYDLPYIHEYSDVWLFNACTFTMSSRPLHSPKSRAKVDISWKAFLRSQEKFFSWASGVPKLREMLAL